MLAIKSKDIKQVYYSYLPHTRIQNGAHCQAPSIIEAKIKEAIGSGTSRFPEDWEGEGEEPDDGPEEEPEEAPEEPEEPEEPAEPEDPEDPVVGL